MIIYTPIPPEILWQDKKETDYRLVEDAIDGIRMQIMLLPDQTARIERILSTDPQDFLRESCRPGTVIEYRYCHKNV
ncbi:MAG: YlzJ-like family protein [Clostridia bacterium]|jgi:hypothetical protein|nr:YlzJ-like family protein [Clostridia bacterium]